MSENDTRLVCVTWDRRSGLVDNLKGQCHWCGADVAYDCKNLPIVEKDHMKLMCLPCFFDKGMVDVSALNGLIRGQKLPLEDAIEAARRLVSEGKPAKEDA